jgi:ferredoxin
MWLACMLPGPREENRAIFVNEVECIGCLKCALIASNTFAIENKYGRARAVGQWGDSESTINDAIQSCPVDCIS